ncbi:manganese catalase family protein [Peribacillus sp. SCS-26]|uniref:manganese catalase family protein n=1 Tax=Paraperibacillus marinus TaxID=3115295 RepID=UPI003905AA9E
MIKRMDRIAIELPRTPRPDPSAAANLQQLLGGKFGEMSTFNNYMFQSFNFRRKKKLRPFYELVASITAEEFGHMELVAHAINLCLEGTTEPGDPDSTPLRNGNADRIALHFIDSAQSALPIDAQGRPWNGEYVVNSGNLIFDFLHNFFLECGARTNKMRVYEITDNPVAREMIGYLLVRGGVHILAYAKGLEMATGVDVTKMFPIPNLDNKAFDHARKFEAAGLHTRLYTFSSRDYQQITQIWKGTHPTDGLPLEVFAGTPKGAEVPDYGDLPEEFAPGISDEDFMKIVERLKRSAGM